MGACMEQSRLHLFGVFLFRVSSVLLSSVRREAGRRGESSESLQGFSDPFLALSTPVPAGAFCALAFYSA